MPGDFILIAVLGESDLWFSGFKSEDACEAYAALSNFDWWACLAVLDV